MNIAITDGVKLMPPGFGAGLKYWSRENGLNGDPTWHGAPNAAIVPADQDFGTCLELVKQSDVTRIRYVRETPVRPGTYLRISARVKAVAGTLPQVRIAGWPGVNSTTKASGVLETSPAVALTSYGDVVEVSAIVSVGNRQGVTMAWGTSVRLGHFGLDLTGPNGGVVRIESIEIEDITGQFLPDLIDWVDVRDYGATGDGKTDDRAAFLAADRAAAGGQILVPDGTYYLGGDLSLRAPTRFKGTVTMPATSKLMLQGQFDFPTYASAFGDETEGFKRAVQALFGFTDHMALDLRGRRVDLKTPVDVAALVPSISGSNRRRVITNGQIAPVDGSAWTPSTMTSLATYDPNNKYVLTNVTRAASIIPGSLITGPGCGREIYVTSVNVGARTVTMSQPLYQGGGTRNYTFTRFKYCIDFAGVDDLDGFGFNDIEFLLEGNASGVILPASGMLNAFRDCYFVQPRDRAITSHGRGCQGLVVDRCDFVSSEGGLSAQDRTTVAINVNANDTKIRNNRASRFCHFLVAAGAGHMIASNHFFQGDGSGAGVRFAGIVLTAENVQVNITGNYIDNASIEWTNEHSAFPDYTRGYSFGGLTISGNTFLCSQTVPGFCWLVFKPFGSGNFIHGMSVVGNVFKSSTGKVTRVDRVDNSLADADYGRMRNIRFSGNTFTGVDTVVANPLTYVHTQSTAAATWTLPVGTGLPFSGYARKVEALVAETAITNASNARVAGMPWVRVEQGSQRNAITLNWDQPAKGRVSVQVRMDNPL
ncbi:MAG: hypothetical protein DI498_07100 [Paracoccus denitrificans]|nr:MAG: hypothetical protein DI498_07100 [Paracoccus denitrificans]PZO84575.1 MAG: hypothetical protein DI633_07100 [Paracoccus denitrificans]